MMRMLRLGVPFSEGLQPQLDAAALAHRVDYTIHASVFTQRQIREMDHCVSKGVSSFKLYMNLGGEVGHVYMDMPPYLDRLQDARVDVTDEIVEGTVRRAAELNCPVLVHAEDYESCACGIKTAKEERRDGLSAWSASRDPQYEAKAIRTVCEYGRRYGCTIYFVHIGSRAALEQIRAERRRGGRILVESCPHYMVLSHEERSGYLAKVMPPIRTAADNEAVWEAAAAGEVDTIGTDHVANRLSLKVGADVWESLAGFPGIGVAVPILLSEGVNRGRISLEAFVRLTSLNAARIFSMYPRKGSLERGADADIAMLDLKRERRVTPELFGGYSDYTVYDGMVLRGVAGEDAGAGKRCGRGVRGGVQARIRQVSPPQPRVTLGGVSPQRRRPLAALYIMSGLSNIPASSTPGRPRSRAARPGGSAMAPKSQSSIMLPFSVNAGYPRSSVRSRGTAPIPRTRSCMRPRAAGCTSSGIGRGQPLDELCLVGHYHHPAGHAGQYPLPEQRPPAALHHVSGRVYLVGPVEYRIQSGASLRAPAWVCRPSRRPALSGARWELRVCAVPRRPDPAPPPGRPPPCRCPAR